MLRDAGLQTEEQIKEFNKDRFKVLGGSHGCFDSAICSNCKHLIREQGCLCAGVFTCPNCGFKNGMEFKLNTDGVQNLSFSDWPKFYSKNDFIKIVDKVFIGDYYDEPYRSKLIEEIEKL